MIKSVNIDGKDYVIRSCDECPFYGEALGDEWCAYPEKRRDIARRYDQKMAEGCPLGLVKDCCTCKYEGRLDKSEKPCIDCTVSIGPGMEESTSPSRWKVKE